MLRWAIIFFVIALVAVLFGSGQVAGMASGIGQLLLVVGVAVAILTMLVSAFRRA
jgi:uncharacterized membrane protein YtjA (UPF0391 family)